MNSDSLLEKIRQRAYQIWQQEGYPDNREREHWARAESEIRAENNSDSRLSSKNDAEKPDDASGDETSDPPQNASPAPKRRAARIKA